MSRRSPLALLLLLGLLIGVLGVVPAHAVALGGFEIDDGNIADDPPPAIDWGTPNLASLVALNPFDDVTGKGDDIFVEGSKELVQTGSKGWKCTTRKAPGKNDIDFGNVAFDIVNGKQYMFVNFVRANVEGDAHMDYEFNKESISNNQCGLPKRTDGDLAVTFDTEMGGAVINLRAFRWTGDAATGTFVQFNNTLLPRGVIWEGAVNIPNTIPGLEAGAFGEAGINLTDSPLGEFECGEFARAYMKTRASTSIDAALKDFTQPRAVDTGNCPNLSLTKTASSSAVVVGDNVTYTIGFANSGTGTAQQATISDTLPAGTSFVSCKGKTGTVGDCTQNGNTITWNVGPVPGNSSGSVELTIRVDAVPNGCELCNTATIDTPVTAASPDASDTECIRVSPGPAPGTASATGTATGVHISDTGFAINQNIPDPPATSSQSGPGEDRANNEVLNVRIPEEGPIPGQPPPTLEVDVISGDAVSAVSTTPAEADQLTVAQVLGLNILNGTITAELVRAVAHAEATPDGSRTDTLGTGFVNLRIDTNPADGQPGELYDNVAPGAFVDLTPLFGKGPKGEKSGVTLRKVTQSTTGTFVADVSVVMIDVVAWDRDPITPNRQTTKVQVSSATAHAEHPSATGCPGSVSGHAFIASAKLPPVYPEPLVIVGFVDIPAYGGHDFQTLNSVSVANGSVLTAGISTSDSNGTLDATSGTSDDFAEVTNLCVLKDAAGPGTGCLVGATLVRSQAHSQDTSGGNGTSNDTGTQLLGLTIAGMPQSNTPARNTVIDLGPLGYVVLNEQFCDGGQPFIPGPVPTCGGSTHTGLTVRSIRLVLLDEAPGNDGLAEVIVAEAHSDATAP